MLRPRIIPCLLVHNQGLVKTVEFGQPKYVGDPINAVRIFNEKEVDELIVLDIDATVLGREPNFELIEHLASECRMPLCYGGGVKTCQQIEKIIGLGVEKVAISSALFENETTIAQAKATVGSQSIVAVLDVRKTASEAGYEVFTHNGSRATGRSPLEMARRFAELGVGEIVINSIDRDGAMQGYDLDLFAQIKSAVQVPLTCLGGAGSMSHVAELVARFGPVGAAAGSMFVFKGALKAVLINYPTARAKALLVPSKGAAESGVPQVLR